MPEPVVEPMPLPPTELRSAVPEEAQEASYFAASLRISSFWSVVSCAKLASMFMICSILRQTLPAR